MNESLRLIHRRRSVRVYEDRPIERETIDAVIRAAMRAPTAGNLMLYSILEIEDQATKEKLAQSCDDQPFIARAPLVLIFLADYQRWIDVFSPRACHLIAKAEAKRCAARGRETCCWLAATP